MAKSSTSWGKFKEECPSCHNKAAAGKQRCKCGAMANAEGKAFFKNDVQPPAEPVVEPVKKPVEPVTGSPSVSPSKTGGNENEAKEPVKSPCEPVKEPVRARGKSASDPTWIW